ncbi:MAG: ATP-binding protein [Acidimicrobiaceae bacterium]|nr:ATP-binding protein [Acidimicrobiaceae bacterium]
MSAPAPIVTGELRAILSRLKLGQMMDTLPERLLSARQSSMSHVDFLEMILADEVARRDSSSALLRAKAAHLDPTMVAEAWDDSAAVTFDRALWSELTTLRFVDNNHNALILGPVGVGKTFLATALGHIGCRRRYRVHFERADKLFKRMKAARLDNSVDAEMRKLVAVDLLVLDDFALHPLDVTDTNLFYELTVERHRRGATVITSNRDPSEFLAQFADPLLAQSAVDRIQSAAYELVIEGESYRRRQRPQMATSTSDQGPSRKGR